ncbi:ABC transporter ATP-binding protein [Candidatus Skiveiella danica]|uniref:ABC transporter ATP-binding protein n=1 Tax=Candidatus Skiveiella danica TaxID=3386177 RepID=UPI0039B82D3D
MLSESMAITGPAPQAPAYAIEAHGLGKCYGLYARPGDRLKQLLWGRWRQYSREFWALQNVDLAIKPGEVVGLVGRNGAGKSTLLQMLCGTMPPTTGSLQVNGKVAALLELGAGFNPEFTGIENVFMNAAILGMKNQEVKDRLDEILAFADIGEFVHQPVKTYSSGMFMRLAFAVATSVEPDILVIDEALSVGDGAFARKSFDRIMGLKEAGKTILFCSHSMYQVEALCSRAMWIDAGKLRMMGTAAEVTSAYQTSLNASIPISPSIACRPDRGRDQPQGGRTAGSGRITRIVAKAGGVSGRELDLVSGKTDLEITIEFTIDPGLPAPSVALGFSDANSLTVASVLSTNDNIRLTTDVHGHGRVVILFPKLPLLKGRYTVTGFLACENALHVYEQVDRCLVLHVTQEGLEQGLVKLPHRWQA